MMLNGCGLCLLLDTCTQCIHVTYDIQLTSTGRQFPHKHRLVVWRFLLQLPQNETAHSGLLQRGTHPAYRKILEEIPTERRIGMRLERLLSSLAHWCALDLNLP